MAVRAYSMGGGMATAVIPVLVAGYSGDAVVYVYAGNALLLQQQVTLREGEPTQVRVQLPAGATSIRLVVATPQDEVLLDVNVPVHVIRMGPEKTMEYIKSVVEGWEAVGAGERGVEGAAPGAVASLEQELSQLAAMEQQLAQQEQQLLEQQKKIEAAVQQMEQAAS